MRECIIEKWGDSFRLLYKKKTHRVKLPADWREDDDLNILGDCPEYYRLENNIIRAKTRIRELAYCNPWDYFATLTLDPDKLDRYDLGNAVRRLGYFFQNESRRHCGAAVKYLLIPEQHRDGAYHFHGLLRGIPAAQLTTNEHSYLDWPSYARSFGFISLAPIRDKEKCANYITKYVSKSLDSTEHEKNEHLFYASKRLAGRERICSVPLPDEARAAYENDWCGLTWCKPDEGLLFTILSEVAQRPSDYFAQAALISHLSAKT